MTKTMQNVITLGICGAFLLGVILTNRVNADSTPLILTFMGFVGLLLNSRVGTNRVEEKVDRVLNGEMEAKIETALKKVLDSRGIEGNE